MSPLSRPERLLEAARATKGFMPDDEGLALADIAERAMLTGSSSIVEVGAYCGRSTLYLASGIARALSLGAAPAVVFSVDHHHGSEENQAGFEHHDDTLVNRETGRMDTLPFWRRTMEAAGAEDLGLDRRRARRGAGLGGLPGLGPPRGRRLLACNSRRVP